MKRESRRSLAQPARGLRYEERTPRLPPFGVRNRSLKDEPINPPVLELLQGVQVSIRAAGVDDAVHDKRGREERSNSGLEVETRCAGFAPGSCENHGAVEFAVCSKNPVAILA